jgi:aldehyde dehydrogenase family protein
MPALRVGCTVVIKPSPFTPLSTLRLVELMNEVLPPGVVNVVTEGVEVGSRITDHPDIDKVVFTGSIATGKKVMEGASRSLKRGGSLREPARVWHGVGEPARHAASHGAVRRREKLRHRCGIQRGWAQGIHHGAGAERRALKALCPRSLQRRRKMARHCFGGAVTARPETVGPGACGRVASAG